MPDKGHKNVQITSLTIRTISQICRRKIIQISISNQKISKISYGNDAAHDNTHMNNITTLPINKGLSRLTL
jgi:hypothetical protein